PYATLFRSVLEEPARARGEGDEDLGHPAHGELRQQLVLPHALSTVEFEGLSERRGCASRGHGPEQCRPGTPRRSWAVARPVSAAPCTLWRALWRGVGQVGEDVGSGRRPQDGCGERAVGQVSAHILTLKKGKGIQRVGVFPTCPQALLLSLQKHLSLIILVLKEGPVEVWT